MQTIGERLEEARKRKGISIREAAEATKIRSDYLQKFEANSFEIDLPPLYIRGFLRGYARYLDLDSDKIVHEFGSATGGEIKPARREGREVYGRVDFGEAQPRTTEAAEEPPSTPQQRSTRPPIDQALLLKYGIFGVGGLLVIILILVVVNLFTSRSDGHGRSASPATSVTVQPEPTKTLTLTATEPTRIKIVQELDNKVLFNGELSRNETRSFSKQGRLLITVEDRTKLIMEVNGRRLDIPRLDGGNYGRFALE